MSHKKSTHKFVPRRFRKMAIVWRNKWGAQRRCTCGVTERSVSCLAVTHHFTKALPVAREILIKQMAEPNALLALIRKKQETL